MSSTVEDATEIRPFRVDMSDEAITDLRRRVAATRWPSMELVDDRSQGVQLATIQELARYWMTDYDWRACEASLNALPMFKTEIDGLDTHFIHVKSRHENALPLIITHGWPGSVIELLGVIGPLTDPTGHGGSAEDAFDLVLPSVPGYGFSAEPTEIGWNPGRVAPAWAELMRRLDYTRYVAQGGDVGAAITDTMGRLHVLPRRDLPGSAQLGREGLPQPHLFQRSRQGRPLCRLGGARAVRDRNPRGVQIAALTRHRRAARANRVPSTPLEATASAAGTSKLEEDKGMTAFWRTPAGLHVASAELPVEGELASFDGATGWLNSQPLTPAGLHSKVVLVDFWTYTCINWLRQLPYVRAWAEKYTSHGLVVIGVHTPEFSFEHNASNVRQAIQDLKITYPVATDNNYAVWSAFGNHYWPALYFADVRGRIRHHHFGEGEYAQSEMVIQQLLADAGATGAGTGMVSVEPRGLEVPAHWASLRSPENYPGYERTEGFASPGGPVPGKPHAYTIPGRLGLNQWALGGEWAMEEEAATLTAAGGQIACRFQARDLNLVTAPANPGTPVRFHVSIDGQPPGQAHGTDTDANGNGTLTQQRTHQLIRQPGPITERTFTITFSDPGAQAYCFTFG